MRMETSAKDGDGEEQKKTAVAVKAATAAMENVSNGRSRAYEARL